MLILYFDNIIVHNMSETWVHESTIYTHTSIPYDNDILKSRRHIML
jgi:hypothetical protein